MTLFADTSVWSLTLRRDRPSDLPHVAELLRAITGRFPIFSTGLVLQELLQGFAGPKVKDAIIDRFHTLQVLDPGEDDHIAAAELRNHCRRSGVQIGTIDALIAHLCIANGLTLLATDRDFFHIARFSKLRLWEA